MNFETDYKNIHFHITLERENIADLSLLMGDKFNRLPNLTMAEIKKGALSSYNVIIISSKTEAASDEELTHYLSGLLLSSDVEELMEDIGEYLEQENVLDDIEKVWRRREITPGPAWRIKT